MNESLARAAVASTADAIITVDLQGRITSWNPAATRLLGHTKDHAVGETVALTIPSEHRSNHIAAFHAAIETGRLAHQGRLALIDATHQDGHRITAEMTLGLLRDDHDARDGAVAVLRPATERPLSFVNDATTLQ